MRRYFVKYMVGGIMVDHSASFMFLQDALSSALWHTQYFGASAILVYHGSQLIAKINKED